MKELFERLYKGTKAEFYEHTKKVLGESGKMIIVTANPEAYMLADKDSKYKNILYKDITCVVPDGIGLVKAAQSLNYPVNERITGVDLCVFLLECADNQGKSIFLYGAKPEIAEAFKENIEKNYPNAKIAGAYHGYNQNEEKLKEEIAATKPDIVLVALGMPRQEFFINECVDLVEKGIFVGVGGSFDVLSGAKKRAPSIFIKLNLEWLYRIAKEPKRLKRFYDNNVKFIFKYKK